MNNPAPAAVLAFLAFASLLVLSDAAWIIAMAFSTMSVVCTLSWIVDQRNRASWICAVLIMGLNIFVFVVVLSS
jgi:hypothetical protein